MREWETKALKELCDFQEGYVNPSQKVHTHFGDEVKWLRAVDLNDSFVWSTSRMLSQEGYESAGKSALLFEPDTLAISKSGTIGRLGILKDYMCGNRAVINVKPMRDRADTRFVFYLLLSGRAQIVELADGSVQKNLYISNLGAYESPVPPLPIQKRIAGILGALDDKIEANRRMNETLEGIARALFKSWFVDFDPVHAKAAGRQPLGPPFAEGIDAACSESALAQMREDIAALFPDSFEDSDLGPIPKGWEVKAIGDVVTQRVERIRACEETARKPYVPIDCIPARSLSLQEFKPGEQAKSSLTKFYKNDILFGAMRPYFHKVCVAPFDGTTRTTAFVLAPHLPSDHSFVALMMSEDSTIDFATAHSTGSTIPYAKWRSSLEDMVSVIPPVHVRASFDATVSGLISNLRDSMFESSTLASIRDALLPKLLSGELSVEAAEEVIEGVA